jgi:signal transduction histidine kinase
VSGIEGQASWPPGYAAHRLLQLQQLTAALSRALTAEAVVDAVANHVLAPLEARAGFVALVESGGYLAIVRALGPDEPQLPPCRFPLSAEVPTADAVNKRTTILLECEDVRRQQYPKWNAGRWSHHGAWAALPLQADGEPVGAMLLCFAQARTFAEDERSFMETAATLCAQALDRARLYDKERRTRRDLEQALARIAEADLRKDEFLAMLSHELRNPLAPVVTALELMRLRNAEPTKEMQIIERQVGNLVRLVDDLLDVSRITRGRIALKTEPMEVASAVTKAVEIVRPLIESKGHRLEVSVPERGLSVMGDGFRLAQVLSNLLTNAARYTPDRGTIILSARRDGAEIVVSTKDSGIGIAPDLLPRIFELFAQGTPSSGQGGLGIGLTLSLRLVEMHGGTLSASSEGPGKGSELVVRLPALEGEQPVAPEVAVEPPSAALVPSPLRILVVDDNVDAASLLVESLAKVGHTVTSVVDGEQALRTLRDFVPDAALLDLGLPGMDGYALAERIHQDPKLRSVRLIAVTGFGRERDRERTRQAGFDAHFVKPVPIRDLLTRLRDLSPRDG